MNTDSPMNSVGLMGLENATSHGGKLLEVSGVSAGYGSVAVLHEVSFAIGQRQLVTIVGANGAGKSTLLRTISGINRATTGTISLDGSEVQHLSSARIAARGIAQVPENRRVFPKHSVIDNLRLGGFVKRSDREGTANRMQDVLSRFPVLGERAKQAAGTLSGGEQQMLAIGMALMADPQVLLLDEPSLGLAPLIVDQVFDHIRALSEQGRAILLVEQLAQKALALADVGYVLQLGRFVASGPGSDLANDRAVLRAYLG
jgi:branched-chain amino acid transport system ATP-binding protein